MDDITINGARVLATFEDVPIFGTIEITQTLTVAWLVMAIITGVLVWLASDLRVTNISRKQAVAEMMVDFIVNFVRGNMGTGFDHYIPLVAAIFLSSLVSNLIGVLGIWSPTADLMTELAWSLVVFVLITYHKIKAAGLGGYFKGFLEPLFILAPINIMAELFTPISMACRHFGNILSGTVISALIYGALTAANNALFGALGSNVIVAAVVLGAGVGVGFYGFKYQRKPFLVVGIIAGVLGLLAILTRLGATFPWLTLGIPGVFSLYFDWFSGCIQAFIFCTLTTLFIKQAADG